MPVQKGRQKGSLFPISHIYVLFSNDIMVVMGLNNTGSVLTLLTKESTFHLCQHSVFPPSSLDKRDFSENVHLYFMVFLQKMCICILWSSFIKCAFVFYGLLLEDVRYLYFMVFF